MYHEEPARRRQHECSHRGIGRSTGGAVGMDALLYPNVAIQAPDQVSDAIT